MLVAGVGAHRGNGPDFDEHLVGLPLTTGSERQAVATHGRGRAASAETFTYLARS